MCNCTIYTCKHFLFRRAMNGPIACWTFLLIMCSSISIVHTRSNGYYLANHRNVRNRIRESGLDYLPAEKRSFGYNCLFSPLQCQYKRFDNDEEGREARIQRKRTLIAQRRNIF
uniref:Secreted protein n=1 Tax=Romanomermis culicivorax TaxID=13658 RepID=A0A915JZT2_ROMCU